MNTTRRRQFIALVVASVVSVASVAVSATPAAAADPVKITVKATDEGFQPNDVEVQQGSVVELTFEWAHQAHTNDEHILVLEGYNLESEKITSQNRTSTLKFIAEKPGTFTFKCDLECDLHDAMQRGQLKVVAGSGGSGTAALLPTKLEFDHSGIAIHGDTVTVVGFLKDENGAPISKAPLGFFLEQTFVGTTAMVQVGSAKTEATGLVSVSYQPRQGQAQPLVVKFDGMGIYAPSELTVDIPSIVNPGTGFTEAPEHLRSIRRGAPIVFVAVMTTIWLIFAAVLATAWTISRVPEGGRRKD